MRHSPVLVALCRVDMQGGMKLQAQGKAASRREPEVGRRIRHVVYRLQCTKCGILRVVWSKAAKWQHPIRA